MLNGVPVIRITFACIPNTRNKSWIAEPFSLGDCGLRYNV